MDVCRRLKQAYKSNRRYCNLQHRDIEFDVTNIVWRRNFLLSNASRLFTIKLNPPYIGPVKVKNKLRLWTYGLVDERGKSKGVDDLQTYVSAESVTTNEEPEQISHPLLNVSTIFVGNTWFYL